MDKGGAALVAKKCSREKRPLFFLPFDDFFFLITKGNKTHFGKFR